jgi:hypothetical protein
MTRIGLLFFLLMNMGVILGSCNKEKAGTVSPQSAQKFRDPISPDTSTIMKWVSTSEQEKLLYSLCGDPNGFIQDFVLFRHIVPVVQKSFIFRADSTVTITDPTESSFIIKSKYRLVSNVLLLTNTTNVQYFQGGKPIESHIDTIRFSFSQSYNQITLTSPVFCEWEGDCSCYYDYYTMTWTLIKQ